MPDELQLPEPPSEDDLSKLTQDVSGHRMREGLLKQWLYSGEKPKDLEEVKQAFLDWLSWSASAAVIEQLQQAVVYLEFVREADKRLFDVNKIAEMDIDTLASRRGTAMRSVMSLLEYIRKFSVGSKEFLLAPGDSEPARFMQLLQSIPTDDLKELKAMVAEFLRKKSAENE